MSEENTTQETTSEMTEAVNDQITDAVTQEAAPEGMTISETVSSTIESVASTTIALAQEADVGAGSEPPSIEALWSALENCRLYAAKRPKEEWARTILRFCSEGGATGSPLR